MTSTAQTVTGTSQHAAWYAGTWPEIEVVRPGLWSVPVPIPDNPLRYTLCYIFANEDEPILVDPGWDSTAGWNALLNGLTQAGLAVEDVKGVVLTHGHPDHHGMTKRLADRNGQLWIGLHPAEQQKLDTNVVRARDRASADRDWMRRLGVPVGESSSLQEPSTNITQSMAMPRGTRMLSDGERIGPNSWELEVVWTPGHTPGHICLFDPQHDALLTGDHVLPRISPYVGLQPRTQAPPLGNYLASLERLSPIDAEILPAHEWRFRGLRRRVAELLDHHRQRCDEVVNVITRTHGATCWSVAEQLSWARSWTSLGGLHKRSALGETAAHIKYLLDTGRIRTKGPSGRAPEVYVTAQRGPEVSSPEADLP